MTYLAALTMVSPPILNASVISPQRSAKAGKAAPIAKDAMVPTVISM